MIENIGTGKSGGPLVLTELNEQEFMALGLILNLAEQHLDTMDFPKVHNRRQLTQAMIEVLRETYGLSAPARRQST